MFGKPGYVFKPSGTPFEVEFPQGMKGKVSTYFGPDLSTDPDKREIAERVHGFHKDYYPVARTIDGCVDISTELQMEDA